MLKYNVGKPAFFDLDGRPISVRQQMIKGGQLKKAYDLIQRYSLPNSDSLSHLLDASIVNRLPPVFSKC
jgi:hypothetical protein